MRVSKSLTPPETGTYLFSIRGSAGCAVRVGGRDVAIFSPQADEHGAGALFGRRDVRGKVELRAGEPVLLEIEMGLFPDNLNVLSLGCRPPQPADQLDRAVRAAAAADAVVLIVGTSEDIERESDDRETTELPGEQETLIRRVLEANPKTIVVVNAATAVDMTWAREASTVLYAWYPGEAFGPALVDVLSGDREPAGRLPITIARRHEDYAAWDTRPIDGLLEYPSPSSSATGTSTRRASSPSSASATVSATAAGSTRRSTSRRRSSRPVTRSRSKSPCATSVRAARRRSCRSTSRIPRHRCRGRRAS